MTSIPLAVSFDCTPPDNASQIQKSLTKFLNGASGGLGGAFDMVSGLNTAVSEISSSMSSLTTSMSSLLEDKLSGFVSTGLEAAKNFIFNKIPNPLAAIAQNNSFLTSAFKPIGKLFGAFGCLGSTIQKALKNTIKNLLTNMIAKGFTNPLECAVEDFIGTLTNKISGLMDSIVGPLINPINSLFSIVGMGFGSVMGVLGKGLNILGKLNGLLNCKDSGATCHEVEHWGLNKGSSKPDSSAKKQNFISKAIDKGTKKIDDLAGKLNKNTVNLQDKLLNDENFQRDEATCNAGNVLDCGLPRVEFFGGGGEGGAGDVILGNFIQELDDAVAGTAVSFRDGSTGKVGSILEDVKTTGSILGVDMKYPGEGYTSEPLVSFVDNCDQGYGAYGRATIDKDPNSPTFGQITGVLMLSEGENYPIGEQTDVFVDRIVVEKGGSGYKLNDKAGDFEICGVDENGSITKVCTNDKAYRITPPTNIDSNGSGAILTPVMTRRRRQSELITVIDCITPRDNIVGYVNGKEYNGPFHVMPNGQKMTGAVHTESDDIIYNTPQESLRDGSPRGASSTRVNLRSIQQLVQESETTESADTYTDPVDDAMDTDTDPTPPSSPPSSPPPSTPPSSGGGGGYGY